MIVKAIICERMKCRGTLIWPAFLLIPVIPILLGAGNYLSNLDLLKSGWYSYWTQVTLFYATFFFAPLIGAYCAFLWRYENFNSCRNTLFSCPVSYHTIYLSKFILVCAISGLTQIWFALLFFASGKVIGLPGLPPGDLCDPRTGGSLCDCRPAVSGCHGNTKLCHSHCRWPGRRRYRPDCRQYEGRTPVALFPDAPGHEFQQIGGCAVAEYRVILCDMRGLSVGGIFDGNWKNKE